MFIIVFYFNVERILAYQHLVYKLCSFMTKYYYFGITHLSFHWGKDWKLNPFLLWEVTNFYYGWCLHICYHICFGSFTSGLIQVSVGNFKLNTFFNLWSCKDIECSHSIIHVELSLILSSFISYWLIFNPISSEFVLIQVLIPFLGAMQDAHLGDHVSFPFMTHLVEEFL